MPPATNFLPASLPSGEVNHAKHDSRHPAQKRNRAQLSCTNCRHAKLKCDRKEPCSQCIKKGKESQCVIPRPAPRRKPAVSMQNRLKHLESLVTAAMSGQQGSQNHGSSSPDAGVQIDRKTNSENSSVPEASSGQVLVENNETTYVGATHWVAILEDIEEVKTYFYEEVEDDEDDDQEHWPTSALTFDVESPTTIHDILAALPPKIVVDQLLSRYFNSNSPTLHIIHMPTFQKEVQLPSIALVINLRTVKQQVILFALHFYTASTFSEFSTTIAFKVLVLAGHRKKK